MKTLFAALMIIMNGVLFVACKKSKQDNSLPVTVANVQAVLTAGQWHAKYYYIDGTDPGAGGNLYGYNFIFQANADLTITNISFSYPGSWSTAELNGQVHLLLDSPYPSAFTNLSKNWDVKTLSATTISLEFANSSSGTTDILNLGKTQ